MAKQKWIKKDVMIDRYYEQQDNNWEEEYARELMKREPIKDKEETEEAK